MSGSSESHPGTENILMVKNRDLIRIAEKQLMNNDSDRKEIYKRLISIASDSLTNDSLKVEIIHFFRQFPCDSCLEFLANHINDIFSAGTGINEIDQYNVVACFTTLGSIATDKNHRWSLIHPILNSLKKKERNDEDILKLSQILTYVSNKNVAKSILEIELNEVELTIWNLRNNIYKNNLVLMLKKLD